MSISCQIEKKAHPNNQPPAPIRTKQRRPQASKSLNATSNLASFLKLCAFFRIVLRSGWHDGLMTFFIGHSTALRYLRSCDSLQEVSYSRATPQAGSVAPISQLINNASSSENKRLHEALAHTPIDLLAGNAASRSKSKLVKAHVCAPPVNTRCFIEADRGIYIASPELCFIQLSRNCTTIELIKLGFELCGTYTLDPSSPIGFRNRKALTSKQAIERMAEKWPGQTNQIVKTALRYISDSSASPMETCLALLFGLPSRLGGYGLEIPQMNAEVKISAKHNKQVAHSLYHCDLYWPSHRVAVEYNSREFHVNERAVERDASRINDLKAAGIDALAVTRAHVANLESFDAVAHSLAKLMGKRLRTSYIDIVIRRRNLRRQLFAKDRWAD